MKNQNKLAQSLKESPGKEVTSLWLAVAVDEHGNEGIAAIIKHGFGAMPMLTSDLENLEMIKELAQDIVNDDPKQRIVIRQFTNPVDVEEITANTQEGE